MNRGRNEMVKLQEAKFKAYSLIIIIQLQCKEFLQPYRSPNANQPYIDKCTTVVRQPCRL